MRILIQLMDGVIICCIVSLTGHYSGSIVLVTTSPAVLWITASVLVPLRLLLPAPKSDPSPTGRWWRMSEDEKVRYVNLHGAESARKLMDVSRRSSLLRAVGREH